ncbi:hypothetical protein [Alishewanella longhuensis]
MNYMAGIAPSLTPPQQLGKAGQKVYRWRQEHELKAYLLETTATRWL